MHVIYQNLYAVRSRSFIGDAQNFAKIMSLSSLCNPGRQFHSNYVRRPKYGKIDADQVLLIYTNIYWKTYRTFMCFLDTKSAAIPQAWIF